MSDQQSDDITLAVVAARLEDLREDVRGMRKDLAQHRSELVGRGEWEQRNRAVDSRFQEQGREIGQLRTEMNTKVTEVAGDVKTVDAKVDQRPLVDPQKASPWIVAGIVLAGIALLAPALSSLIELIDKIAH